MAELIAEMTLKINPELSDEGKELIRQLIREEMLKMQMGLQSIRWQEVIKLQEEIEHKPTYQQFEVK